MKESRMRFWVVAAMLNCAAVMGASPAFAGPAAIGSCGKVITAPGSFVVTRNLTVKTGGQNCITVASSFVTIDLQGFTIDCAGKGGDGVNAPGSGHVALTVRNGKITGCFNGIDASVVPQTTVDGVTATKNSSYGMWVASGSLVKNCVTSGNTNGGIRADCPSNVIENTSVGNTGLDIDAGASCNVSDNAIDP